MYDLLSLWDLMESIAILISQSVSPKKFQLMFLGLKRKQGLRLNIQGSKIVAKDYVKPSGVEIDNKLRFDKHVQTLCQKVNKKTCFF